MNSSFSLIVRFCLLATIASSCFYDEERLRDWATTHYPKESQEVVSVDAENRYLEAFNLAITALQAETDALSVDLETKYNQATLDQNEKPLSSRISELDDSNALLMRATQLNQTLERTLNLCEDFGVTYITPAPDLGLLMGSISKESYSVYLGLSLQYQHSIAGSPTLTGVPQIDLSGPNNGYPLRLVDDILGTNGFFASILDPTGARALDDAREALIKNTPNFETRKRLTQDACKKVLKMTFEVDTLKIEMASLLNALKLNVQKVIYATHSFVQWRSSEIARDLDDIKRQALEAGLEISFELELAHQLAVNHLNLLDASIAEFNFANDELRAARRAAQAKNYQLCANLLSSSLERSNTAIKRIDEYLASQSFTGPLRKALDAVRNNLGKNLDNIDKFKAGPLGSGCVK
jgi:hypothetical protein